MRIYPLHKVEADVRLSLDRNMRSRELQELGDTDTLSVDQVIRSKIVEAVRRVHSAAPLHLIDGGYSFASQPFFWGTLESGWMILPEDFMRFVAFRMSDWERRVTDAITPADSDYELQSSRFKGIRGTAQRPVCAIVIRPEGHVLEFYSCRTKNATVAEAMYLPLPRMTRQEGIGICSKCYEAVIYTAALLTLTTFGDTARAAAMGELVKSILS